MMEIGELGLHSIQPLQPNPQAPNVGDSSYLLQILLIRLESIPKLEDLDIGLNFLGDGKAVPGIGNNVVVYSGFPYLPSVGRLKAA